MLREKIGRMFMNGWPLGLFSERVGGKSKPPADYRRLA